MGHDRKGAGTVQMGLAQLPLDADDMLTALRRRAERESPTHDAAAVNRMMDLVGGHTLHGHLMVDSLVPRAQLLAGLLATVTGR